MSKFNLLKRTPSKEPPKTSHKVFGVSLEQLVERQGSAIPELVNQCAKCLERGIDSSGLFATTPKKVKVQLLRKQVEDSPDSDLAKSKDYHEVADVLRGFFAELTDPLLTFKLYDTLIAVSKMENGEGKLQKLHNAFNALPAANRVILGYLITFFRKCLEHKKNQVTPTVVGKYFGSALLHPRGDINTHETALVSSLLSYLVEEYPNLMKMTTRPPESPSQSTTPQEPFKTPTTTTTTTSNGTPPNSASARATTATSTPTNSITSTSSATAKKPTTTPRAVASPRATSPASPQTTPRTSPTPISPRNLAQSKSRTPNSATAKKPAATPTTSTSSSTTNTTSATPLKKTAATTTSSSSPVSSNVRTTAQNIHQMQQQQLQSRLSQIQVIKQQREVLRSEQQKDKEQKEREQKEQEQREREQKEREQKEREVKEKEDETNKEQPKKAKSNPANHRLQRPALLRMKVNYDFEARDDTEITVVVGGMVDVVSKDESGWWWGRVVNGDGKVGLFPSNYCEVVESFSPSLRKFNISQLNLKPLIRDLQKECGFVKEGSQSTPTKQQSEPDLQPETTMQPETVQPDTSNQLETSQPDIQIDLDTSTQSDSSPRKKKPSLKIEELQKSMSKLKGFPGTPTSESKASPPASPASTTPPRSPTSPSYRTSSISPASSFGKGEGYKLSPSQSFMKNSEGNKLTPSNSFSRTSSGSGAGDGHKLVTSTSFGKGSSAASEGYKITPSQSFSKGGQEESHRITQSQSFTKGSPSGGESNKLAPSNSFSKKASPKDAKRKLKTRKERKSQTIEDLQNMMQNMRGFPATPEAVKQRQSRDSEPSFALQRSASSKSRIPSSRIENGNDRFSPNSKLTYEDNVPPGELDRPSTPLNHLTKKRAKPAKRRPASIGSIRKLSQSVRSLETAEAVQETLQLLDEEVHKRQEMEALANSFKKEYEEERKLRNQLEDENIQSSNLFDKLKDELEQQNHSANMLRYEKDALESMTRQLKREAMDAVSKYEEIQISKNGLQKELEEMRRKLEEALSERDAIARERDRFKRDATSLEDDLKALESKNRLDKSNNLEELSAAQKQALDLQAQVITHQKAKSDVQVKLDQALKELELAREREAKLAGSMHNERSELERLRNAEMDRLTTMKHLEEQKGLLEERVNTLKESCKEEQILRKKYFNMIEAYPDMKGKIRVMCRTRPISDKEAASGQKMACDFADPFSITINSKTFGFDRVFDPRTSQEEVFSDTSHLVQSALDGYNVCIFAYGQTGSGKTHTLLGDDTNPGLCPRAMAHLYDSIKRDEGRFKVSVRCYLLELYNDNLVDLLLKRDEKPAKLVIKKDSKGMVYVENVTLRKASTAEKLRAFMVQGLKHRHTGATKMNDQSSRSHLIFSILIKSKNLQTKQHSTGKLSFVDLAGSERAARSGATDERLREAKSINKSLSALGNVINALSSGESFVPYRNNKLTQLMSDSIGGNAKTLMLVNVAPGDANADESLQSLAYGQRAKLITNTATKMVESAEVQRLKKIIAQLRTEKGEPVEQDEVLEVESEPNGADEDPQSDE